MSNKIRLRSTSIATFERRQQLLIAFAFVFVLLLTSDCAFHVGTSTHAAFDKIEFQEIADDNNIKNKKMYENSE
jgi:hypothetical protein